MTRTAPRRLVHTGDSRNHAAAAWNTALDTLSTVGECRCGYKLSHIGADLQWSLGAELWVAVRLTKTNQPLSSKKQQEAATHLTLDKGAITAPRRCGAGPVKPKDFPWPPGALTASKERSCQPVRVACKSESVTECFCHCIIPDVLRHSHSMPVRTDRCVCAAVHMSHRSALEEPMHRIVGMERDDLPKNLTNHRG